MDLKVEYISIENIKAYENNAKIHTREQIEQIKKSIQEFSMIDPIGIWHEEIVEGHGRFLACKELGLKTVPVIRLDSLSDEQRRAYMLVHNKLTMNTDFDFVSLEDQLTQIENIDMSDYGFAKISDIEEELGDFFIPDDNETYTEKKSVTFVINKPEDRKMLEELFHYLDQQEINYAEK